MVRKSLPSYLRMEEVDRLLAQPNLATPQGVRDRAIIELLYSTGMRVSELVNLRVSDMEMRMGCLRCIGKGDKERMVPVGRKALAAVQQYLETARPEFLRTNASAASPPQNLFINRSGNRISRIGIWRLASRAASSLRLMVMVTSRHLRTRHLRELDRVAQMHKRRLHVALQYRFANVQRYPLTCILRNLINMLLSTIVLACSPRAAKIVATGLRRAPFQDEAN